MGKNARRTRAGRAAITAPQRAGREWHQEDLAEIRSTIAAAVAALNNGSLSGAVICLAEATALARDTWLKGI
jgi:hypothetical protein